MSKPHVVFEQLLLQDDVAQAISLLPPAQRQTVTLFYMGEYSQQEIIGFIQKSVTAVQCRNNY